MKKGEIWLVELPEGKGHEQKGLRPALVVGGANGITTAIPLTKNVERLKFSHTLLIEPSKDNGLTEASVALVFQISSLDETRFKKQLGWIPKEQRNAIDELLLSLLEISSSN